MAHRYIVTGGAGFIGSNLVHTLMAAGANVTVIDNLHGGKKENVPLQAKVHVMDIRDGARALSHVCTGADGIFHLAALPRVPYSIEQPELTAEVNELGTVRVLEAARLAGVPRVVFASSSSVYGNQGILPLIETMAPQPLSPYAAQKLASEYHCRVYATLHGVQTVSLRFFNVYGPNMNPNGTYALAIGRFLSQRRCGKPLTIYGDGTQTRDFTHVIDVTRACLLAMSSPHVGTGEAINIGAGNPVSINQIAHLIGGPVVHEASRPGEPRHTHASIAYARAFLDWEPVVQIGDGIADLKKRMDCD